MAKGRKLTTSRSELYLGTFDYNQNQGNFNGSSELREDEVWSMVEPSVNGDDHPGSGDWNSRASMDNYRTRRPPPPPEHHGRRQTGGLSLAFDDSSNSSSSPRLVHQFRGHGVSESRHVASSAPVNVPDWSKIYRVDSVESMREFEDDGGEIDYDSELVPPHEYLARSRRIAANLVFEGVGRTLKGRDLSRVRDAVWSQTGFDG